MAAPIALTTCRPVVSYTSQFHRFFTFIRSNKYSTLSRDVKEYWRISGTKETLRSGVCHSPKQRRTYPFSVRRLTALNSSCKQTAVKREPDYTHIATCYKTGLRFPDYCRTRIRNASSHANSAGSLSGGSLVLGIETSCDDTGAAVVDPNGRVLGEALNSQTRIHVEMGGIIPHVARDLHKQNIEDVVQGALKDAGVTLQDLDAIACTVEPGLILSLDIGTKYAKKLVMESRKPFIPIHHMEAHALTVRMIEEVPFPFLVLLISGGHSLLAVARDVDDFLLLGTSMDEAPGDAFDKTARKLKLKNLPECEGLSGGAAIEKMARGGDPRAFPLTTIMSKQVNCDFSFCGAKEAARHIIEDQEAKYGVGAIDVIPNVADVCATFQYYVLHHLAKRLQRALLFCEMKELLPKENKTLVISGGVGSNTFIREGLQRMCQHYDCRVVCPPPKLCTDNGIMIAWNGMEKWKVGRGIASDIEAVKIKPKSPLGRDIRQEVEKCSIKLTRIKLL